jgi:hypothetical protein
MVGALGRRRTADHRTLESDPGAAAQLPHALVHIFERDQRDRGQPFGIVGTELRRPIIVGSKASLEQFDVGQAEQRHAQRGVEHLGLDAVDFLILDALHRIPAAGPRVGVGLGRELLEHRAAGAVAESAADRKGAQARREKYRALFIVDHARGAFGKLLVHPRRPQIGRLREVRVGGNHSWRCHRMSLGS